MNSRTSDIALGVVFFSALAALGIMTIYLSDFALGVERHDVRFLSDDVGFLRSGDPVLMHGMSVGKVTSIERLEDPQTIMVRGPTEGSPPRDVRCIVAVTTRLDVDPREYLRDDYRVFIEDRGVLGGKLLRIEVGDGSQPAQPGPLVATASQSVLQSAGAILEENRENLRLTIDSLADIADGTRRGRGTLGRLVNEEDLIEEAQQVLANLREVGDMLVSGDGTLPKLLNDPALHDDLETIVADVRSYSDRIKRGEGTLGKLVQDDGLYGEATGLLTDARQTFAAVNSGDGTLGKLVTDDTIHADAAAMMAELRELAETANSGDGTLGRLLEDETLYENANAFFEDLGGLADDLTEGDGLLAALVNDEKMADDLRNILAQVLGAIEDARETTPVRSVGSLLFGTF